MVLRDADGNVVPAKIADAGVAFGYDLPDDRFRQPYMAKKVLVTFEAEVPALGYRTYIWKQRSRHRTWIWFLRMKMCSRMMR